MYKTNVLLGGIIMTTATLVKMIRDPRSGKIHLPSERVAILAIVRNLDRTLFKVRWQAGGDCVVFPDDLNEARCMTLGEREQPQNLSLT